MPAARYWLAGILKSLVVGLHRLDVDACGVEGGGVSACDDRRSCSHAAAQRVAHQFKFAVSLYRYFSGQRDRLPVVIRFSTKFLFEIVFPVAPSAPCGARASEG